MSHEVLILDTSVLCCWLQVPGKETAGPQEDRWDHPRISRLLEDKQGHSTLVIPLAALIETGNHIAQAPARRRECAQALAEHLRATVEERSPWAAFTDQSPLWDKENLLKLAAEWPELAAGKLSIGDATIKDVAEYYARAGFRVTILTGDAGLKAYEPVIPVVVPRRRR